MVVTQSMARREVLGGTQTHQLYLGCGAFYNPVQSHRTHCGQMTGWELGIQGLVHVQASWPTALTDQVGWSGPRVCTQQAHDSLLTTVFQHLALGAGLTSYLLDNC